MDANEYQKQAARTLLDKPDFQITDWETMVVWNALGLAGEAGEVCEMIKKTVCHRHTFDGDKLKKELGDVTWYLAALCTKFGLNLSDVLSANIEKLNARYPNGYSHEDSQKRIDVFDVLPFTLDERSLVTEDEAKEMADIAGLKLPKIPLCTCGHGGGPSVAHRGDCPMRIWE